MTFEQLEYFIAIAKFLNITKAAESLYISQPTLSRKLSLLEESLNVKLFNRKKNSISLTTAGSALFDKSLELLQHKDRIEAYMRSISSGSSGVITVGSIKAHYPPLYKGYKTFTKTHSNVELILKMGESNDIYMDILNGSIDVGILLSFQYYGNSDLEIMELSQESFCLLCAGDMFRDRKSISVAELKDSGIKLYFLVEKAPYQYVSNLWKSMAVDEAYYNRMQVDSIESAIAYVKAGLGATIVPHSVAKSFQADCNIIHIHDIDASYNIVACYRKDLSNPAARQLLRCLKSMDLI